MIPVQYTLHGITTLPRDSRKTRTAILEAGYRLFYREGFARVSMDAIAAEAGVMKRTLYYHHASKDDLLAAVLQYQDQLARKHFESWVSPEDSTAEAFLQSLFGQLESWSRSDRWMGSGFTRLTMELADLPGHPVRAAASRHKAAVEGWLLDELQSRWADARKEDACMLATLLEGAMALTLIHGGGDYIRTARLAAERLLATARQARSDH